MTAESSVSQQASHRPDEGPRWSSPPDALHTVRDAAYLRDLQEEAEFWDARPQTLLTIATSSVIQEYINERLTGHRERQWFETISEHGDFKRGCMLGAGPGEVEAHLLAQHDGLSLTIYDISSETLARLAARLEQDFAGRFETCREDLNFIELPPSSYDLFVADSSIHHILNLEHLAYQVNRALTPDGWFFLRDTVSENYFQFSDEKKRLYELAISLAYENPQEAPPIAWPDRNDWQFSPFESVRSEEILGTFSQYFQEVSVRATYTMLGLCLFGPQLLPTEAPPPAGLGTRLRRLLGRGRDEPRRSITRDRLQVLGDLLFALDRLAGETGMAPGMAFAVYRKRAGT